MSPGDRELANSRPYSRKVKIPTQVFLYLLLVVTILVPLLSISLEQESDTQAAYQVADQLIDGGLFRATQEVLTQAYAYRLEAIGHQKQLEQLRLAGAGREEITDYLQARLTAAEPPLTAILYATPQEEIKVLGANLAVSQPLTDERLLETYHSTGPPADSPAGSVQPIDLVRLPPLSREDGSPFYAARLSLTLETRNREPARVTWLMDPQELLAPLTAFVDSLHQRGAPGARIYLRNLGASDESTWTILCMPQCRVRPTLQNGELAKLLSSRPTDSSTDNNRQWQMEHQRVFARRLTPFFPFFGPDSGPTGEVLLSLPDEQLPRLLGTPPGQPQPLFYFFILLALLAPLLVLVVIRERRQARPGSEAATYQSIVETSPNGILLADADGIIVTANARIGELSGYPQHELIGQRLERLVPGAYRGDDAPLHHDGQQEPADRALNTRYQVLQTATEEEIAVAVTQTNIIIDDQPHTLTLIRDRRAERAFAEERERLNLVAEHTHDHVIITNFEGQIIWANATYINFIRVNAEQLKGQSVFDRLRATGTDEQVIQRLKDACQNRRSDEVDAQVGGASGQHAWIEIAATPTESYLVFVARDVTARYLAAEERERLTLVAEHTHDHVIITNFEGQIIWANATYINFIRVNAEQLKGQSVFDRLRATGTDEQVIQRLKEACQNRRSDQVDAQVGGASGQHVWIEIAATPTESYLVFVARDVTARYLAAEERERLTLVAEHTHDMVVIADLELRSVWVNPALCRFANADPERLKVPLTDLLKMANASQEAVQKIEEACQARRAAVIETPVENQTGKRFWIEIAINPVEKYLVLVSRDVTGRHLAAEQLAESNRQLERRVSERTRELTLAKEQAESANRAKSAFLSTMTHEIRTPLHGVIASADLMRERQMDKVLRSHLRRIERSADNLARILDGVLDFSRIESGRLELEHEPLMLRTLLEGAVSALHPLARGKGVQLLVNVAPQLDACAVYGDSVRLTQVVNNLLGNAIKFSVGQPQPLVVLRAHLADQQESHLAVVLEVTDNGIGMTKTEVEKIFEPFIQAQSDITRHYGGTGLGLTITQGLVEAMAGDINIASAPKNGSTFTVNLRLPTCFEVTPPDYPSLSGARLLVLPPENDELKQIILSYLGSADAEVEWGKQHSLQALDEQISAATALGKPYQLVLVGDLNSSLLAPLVKAAAGSAYPPLLFLDDGDIEPGELPGGIIQQPITRLALLEQVAATLGLAPPTPQKGSEARLSKGRGELILVVEDNAVNQEVFAEQLQRLGYRHIIAADGLQALDEFDHQQFSVVLTDCHMPRMDGYELAREIRRREGEMAGSRRTPIIAVTADITAEERRRCSRAGMDEWLAKPVVLADIAAALARWVTDAPTPDAGSTLLPQSEGGEQIASRPVVPVDLHEVPASSTGTTGADDLPPLNIEALAEIVGDDLQVQQRFIKKFLQSAPPIVAAMIAAAKVGDAALASKQAHKLKSSARAVGAYQLATACEALEASGKAGETADLNSLAVDVELALDRARQYAAMEYRLNEGNGRGD